MSDTKSLPEKQASSSMVERLARIMCVSESADDPDDTALSLGTGKRRWQAWEKPAATALALLTDCGYAIVPVEPTPAMWASVNLVGRAHVSKLCSVEGWRAMLDAARVAE